jgi:hypothetical protein
MVGKILAGLATTETGATAPAPKTNADTASGAASSPTDFSQTVDAFSQAAAAAAQQGAHPGARS